jgi:Holliday junction resolvasome RuvABC endonuclease subunit
MGRIITLDVSECATGWAVVTAQGPDVLTVERHGCIVTKPGGKRVGKTADDIRRCSEIAAAVAEIVEGWPPRLIVAEMPTGSQRAAGAKAMGMCLGILGSVRIILDIPCEWITPQAVKKAAGGKLNATKGEVQAGVLERWPDLQFRNQVEREAVCDALGALLAARGTDLYLMAARVCDATSEQS